MGIAVVGLDIAKHVFQLQAGKETPQVARWYKATQYPPNLHGGVGNCFGCQDLRRGDD
jgi:hypothetical protein